MKGLIHLLIYLFGFSLSVHSATVSTLYEFPSGSWVENIAVRSNGNVLVVLFSEPSVYEINPFESLATAKVVAHFDGFKGIQGITETTPDVFAVMPFQGPLYSLWTFDASTKTQKQIISSVPGAGLLNGLTKLTDTVLLASDSKYGNVVRFDLTSSSSAIAIKDDTMAGLPLVGGGINGLRARNNTLFYNNSIKGKFCRVEVDMMTGTAVGPTYVIASSLGFIDDLAIGEQDGDPAYLMGYLAGSVIEVRSDGSSSVIVTGLNFPTSAAWGRTQRDGRKLYVSSSGNPAAAVLKPFFAGGKVFAVDTS